METRYLKTFLQVAERKSFTKAAEHLGYSQSTVSAQIKQLETELNAPLFERINHKIILTEKGMSILNYAQQIIVLTEEMTNCIDESDQCSGLVRFAIAPSLCDVMLGKTYARFHNMYPNITVKIITAVTEELLNLLNQNEADLIFTLDHHTYNTDYTILSEKRVKMSFVASASSELSKQKNIDIRELVKHPFVLTEKGISYRKLLDDRLAEMYLEVKPVIEMENANLACELAEMGVGISFLPDYVTRKSYEEGKIAYLDVKDFEIDIWRQLLCHKDKWVSPAMKRVIDYCSSYSEEF